MMSWSRYMQERYWLLHVLRQVRSQLRLGASLVQNMKAKKNLQRELVALRKVRYK